MENIVILLYIIWAPSEKGLCTTYEYTYYVIILFIMFISRMLDLHTLQIRLTRMFLGKHFHQIHNPYTLKLA